MNSFLKKDANGNWNTVPPVPDGLIKNVNCHKFALFQIGKIAWEDTISDPEVQKSTGADFTFGDKARSISEISFELIGAENSLDSLAKESCQIGKEYIGQILDAKTGEMAHSFIVRRDSENDYVCFDKPGFKYPFTTSDLPAILNFTNRDGEQSNKNQGWRFVPIGSAEK